MGKKNIKKESLKKKLTDKYRLVVLNENTFEERFSLKLSRLNVFVLGGICSFFLIALTTFFIALTPIKEYIPGYSSSKLKSEAVRLAFETDSLKQKLTFLENYTNALKPVLTGNIEAEHVDSIQLSAKLPEIDENLLNASKQDSLFREKTEAQNRFALLQNAKSNIKIVFFAPLNGAISNTYDSAAKHLGIDITAKVGSPVKATADGTVIFSGWTSETGHVLILKHTNNYVSVYKHNGNLLKEQGDFVKSGEAIATVGSTGNLTTGPHLHFELWSDGFAINPSNFIDFN